MCPARLKRFDDTVFMFRKNSAEAVGFFNTFRGTGGQMIWRLIGKKIRGRLDMSSHAQPSGNFRSDGDIVTGNHFHGQTMFLGLANGFLRIIARRIKQRHNAEELPGFSVVGRFCHAQSAKTASREILNLFRRPFFILIVQVTHADNDLPAPLW